MQFNAAPLIKGKGSKPLFTSAVVGLMLSLFSLSAYCQSLLGKLMDSGVASVVATLHENNEIWGLAFSPDGKLLATMSPGNVDLNLWDWRSGKIVRTLKRPSSDTQVTEPISFSPDGRFLASCQAEAGRTGVAIRIWDTTTWQVAKDIRDPISWNCYSLAFTPDSQTLIRATGVSGKNPDLGDNLVFYSTETWQPTGGVYVDFDTKTLAMSPDGRYVATAGDRATAFPAELRVIRQPQIAIVDVATHHLLRTIDANAPSQRGNLPNKLVWSPDGKHIAIGFWIVGHTDDAVRVFDVHSGALAAGEKTEYQDSIYGLRYTPNGKYLIEANSDRIRIWDGKHTQLLQTISAKPASLAVSQDGKYFAAAGYRLVAVWGVK